MLSRVSAFYVDTPKGEVFQTTIPNNIHSRVSSFLIDTLYLELKHFNPQFPIIFS